MFLCFNCRKFMHDITLLLYLDIESWQTFFYVKSQGAGKCTARRLRKLFTCLDTRKDSKEARKEVVSARSHSRRKVALRVRIVRYLMLLLESGQCRSTFMGLITLGGNHKASHVMSSQRLSTKTAKDSTPAYELNPRSHPSRCSIRRFCAL
jgi:hypothetical protein